LPDYIYATYNTLIKADWRMQEIDGMDMLGFLRLRAWDAKKEEHRIRPKPAYIDDVWPNQKHG